MTTSISISTGPLTSAKTVQNDAKAQEILDRYALSMGFEGTAKQKLDQIVEHLASILQEGAAGYQYVQDTAAIRDDVKADNTFE